MPELNFNYDPAWMQEGVSRTGNQPMSLAEAFQLKQKQKQDDALLPLKQQQMQQEIAAQALDHTVKQEQFDVALKMKANSTKLWSAISETDFTDPASISKGYRAVAEMGGLVDPKGLNIFETNVKLGQQYKLKEQAFQQKAADDAAKQKEIDARDAARIASREKIAQAKLDLEKDAIKLRGTGKAVTFDEFYNRHLNKFIDQGLNVDDASKEARRVFDAYLAKPGTFSPSAAPIGDPKDPAGLFKLKPQ